MTVEYNGEAEFPPIEQGVSELLGILAALIVLLIVFRTFVAAFIPIMLAIVALATAFLLLFILAGLTDINTVTPILVSMIGLGVGIDYSLFIVTRFRQLLHEGLAAAGRGRRGGRVRGPRGALRRAHGRDLGDRARVLRPRLRDEARDRQRARRAHDRAARELVPARGAGAARPQGRPAQGAVPAPRRRLGGRAREDARRALGPLRDANARIIFPVLLVAGILLAANLRARPARRGRPGHAAEGADEPARLRPARRGLRARVQRPDPDRRRHEGRPGGAAADLRGRPGPERRRVRARAAAQRREDRRDRVRDADVGAAGPGDRRPRRPAAERRRAGGDRRTATRSPTSPARRRRSRTSATGSCSGCRCSCSTSSASRSSCSRWRSARSSSR